MLESARQPTGSGRGRPSFPRPGKAFHVLNGEVGEGVHHLDLVVGKGINDLPLARFVRKTGHDLDVQIGKAGHDLNFVVGETCYELNLTVDLRDIDLLIASANGEGEQKNQDERGTFRSTRTLPV